MNRLLFYIALFFLSTQIGLSEGIDSLKWIKMPVKTYPDYPVQIHDIDSSCFFRHKITYKSYTSSIPYVKRGRTIKVRCKNKTYKFKDSRNEGEQEYFVEGSYNNWIIIKAYLYYNYEQFYFINVKSGEIDSLAGEPLFYDNKILCFEGDNTDGTKMMEVWQFMDEKIFLIYSADLKRRRIYSIDDYYLRNDTVFLRTGERYLKLYYGGPWGSTSTNQGFQPYKYNGKELDRIHGLDWYDYGARRYDPAYCLFTQIDPLAEKYPHLSPYAYCAGNPVRYIDPDGRHIRVKKKDGVYLIDGGEVDDDLNIYDVTNGWDNRVSIGEALTQYSFFNDNGEPSLGSVIDPNDQSGQKFWNNFKTWAPFMPLLYYILNGYGGQKYDFKRQGEPYPGADKNNKEQINANNKYHNRGMKLNIDGKEYITSGRDIGNYAAGYVAGLHGLTWKEARYGFDKLESKQQGGKAIEKAPSQSAQLKGYTNGWVKSGLIRRLILLKLLLP